VGGQDVDPRHVAAPAVPHRWGTFDRRPNQARPKRIQAQLETCISCTFLCLCHGCHSGPEHPYFSGPRCLYDWTVGRLKYRRQPEPKWEDIQMGRKALERDGASQGMGGML
jgi:hypothetical protein